ncbi:hypothetical protein GQ57_35955 [Burkholderia sp. MSh2]|nr:hypothetical protein GQ57_35955 [Burkholderia sp. MSh2]KVX47751.1 hypothetical protein WL06_32020 [Burkholderia cepacia]KWD57915.1 hypothetical protein WL68_28645 [Burkholderia cepacia]KWD79261.1 hypothetical protein WL69_21600 [Burkholderia cepacia]
MTKFVVADSRWRTRKLRQKGLEVIPASAVIDWHMAVDMPLSFSLCRDHLHIFLRGLGHYNGFPIPERQFDGWLVILRPQIQRFALLIWDYIAL